MDADDDVVDGIFRMNFDSVRFSVPNYNGTKGKKRRKAYDEGKKINKNKMRR